MSRSLRGTQPRRALLLESLESRLLLANTISDSGGFEGSQQTLMLEGNGGGVVEYRYQHFTIPDNFILRYEGKNLLETGFVPGDAQGMVTVPQGDSNVLEVIVATNDEGTAWNYTVTAEGCGDTGNFNLELADGEFMATTDPDGTVKCTGTGTIHIGRKDGIERMLRVENGTIEYDKKGFVVSGAFHSEIGNSEALSTVLFTGSFEMPFLTGNSTSFTDSGGGSNEFQLAERDVEFKTISINNNGMALTPEFSIPEDFGVTDLFLTGSDGLVISENLVRLAPSFKFSFPELKNVNLFKFLPVEEISGVCLSYDGTQDTLKIEGKLVVDVLPADAERGKLTLDFTGSNFIQIKGEEVDFVGELTAQTGLRFGATKWGVDNIKLGVDTIQKDVTGSAEFVLGKQFVAAPERKAVLGLGFKTPIPPFELNLLSIDVDNLNWPFAPWPAAFWQGFTASLDNLASSDLDSTEYSGSVKATLGPRVSLPSWLGGADVALVSAEVGGTLNGDQFMANGQYNVLHPNVLNGSGSATFNWSQSLLTLAGTKQAFAGLVTTTDTFQISTSNYGVVASGSAAVAIPSFVPLIGGAQLASGSYLIDLRGAASDSVAGWGTVSIQKLGLQIQFVAGVKCFIASGDCERIGSKNIPETSSFSIQPDTPWVLIGADWANPSNGNVPLEVVTPAGTVIPESEFAANNIAIVDALSDDHSKVVLIADPTPGVWDLRVVDGSGLGEITYSAAEDSTGPQLVLSGPQPSGEALLEIGFDATQVASPSTVRFFSDTDGSGFDGVFLGEQILGGASSGTFSWNTTGVAPGDYYVYAIIDDGLNTPTFAYAPESIEVAGGSELAVALVGETSGVLAGDVVDVRVDVSNLGQGIAKETVVALALPDGADLIHSDIPVDRIEGREAVFELGEVAPGSLEQWGIQIGTGALPVLSLDARATTSSYDGNLSNNVDEIVVNIEPQPFAFPDLQVQLTPHADEIVLGDEFAYSIRVTNAGAADATNVELTEYLPIQSRVIEATAGQGNVVVDAGAVPTVVATFAELPAGASVDVAVTLLPLAAGDLTSSTVVTSNEDDRTLADNYLIQVNTVQGAEPLAADLQLDVTVDNDQPRLDDEVAFELTIENRGPGIASGIRVASDFSGLFEPISAVADQGSFDLASGIWDVGNVRDDLARKLTITARVIDDGDALAAFEIIAANEADPDSVPGNADTSEDDWAALELSVGSPTVLLSGAVDLSFDGASVQDEDILTYDEKGFRLFFDGSDVGLASTKIDAVGMTNEGDLWLSVAAPRYLPGIASKVDDADIVRFVPDQLGVHTSGTFELMFDASAVGLRSEDVWAITILPDETLLLAFANTVRLTGLDAPVNRGDIVAYSPASSENGGSTWDVYFDGSDVGMHRRIDALTTDDDGNLYVSSDRTFTLDGLVYRDHQFAKFLADSLGDHTSGTWERARFFANHPDRVHLREIRALDVARLSRIPNEMPVAQDDFFEIQAHQVLTDNVLRPSNARADEDIDGDRVSVTAVNATEDALGQPIRLDSGAYVTVESDGEFTYDPRDLYRALPTGERLIDQFSYTIDDGRSGVATATVRIEVYGANQFGQQPLYLVTSSREAFNGTPVREEDVYRFDGSDLALFFDGSDVGLSGVRIDALEVRSPSEILLSFRGNASVPGIPGVVSGAEVVKFTASGTGDQTQGVFERYFDGTDVGLLGEDIDAFSVLDDGRLLVSTRGPVRIEGRRFRDEDVLVFQAESLVSNTAGSWDMFFDGSDVSLRNDVDAVAVEANGRLLLSTRGSFQAGGQSGRDEDIFGFLPTSLGNSTRGNYSEMLVADGSLVTPSLRDVVAFDLSEEPESEVRAAFSFTSTSWRNVRDPLDVDGNERVTPLDVLLLINELVDRSATEPITGALPIRLPRTLDEQASPRYFFDVNGDSRLTPLDALLVINGLDQPQAASSNASESLVPLDLAWEVLFDDE